MFYAKNQRETIETLFPGNRELFSSEAAIRVCDAAPQIHGGYGYTDACDVHRHLKDARLLTIAEGTSEMLRRLIARLSLKEEAQGNNGNT